MDSDEQSDQSTGGRYFTPYSVDFGEFTKPDALGGYMAKFSDLPVSVKKITQDFSTAVFVEETLGVKYGLSTEQKTELTRVIRDVLLADVFMGDMVKIVTDKLAIDPETAREISNEVVSELFAPALSDIKIIQRAKFTNQINRVPTPAGSPPSLTRTAIPPRPIQNSAGINENNVIDLRNQNQE